ncbi:MAG: hypothetical protein QNJ98_00855 [Planctomycetota bacterium]|nr:hypothetical protein [Planctomycetota bacterium]
MRRGGLILLLLLLAAGAIWWLLEGGPLGAPDVDPYAADEGDVDSEPGLEGREAPGPQGDPARPDDPGSDADDTPEATGIVLIGRVVDERRRPVAEARVEARFPDRPTRDATTDAEGRFELAVGERPGVFVVGTLHARTDDGRVAAGPVSLQASSPARRDVRPLVVGPAYSFDVRIERAGAPVAGAAVVVARPIWAQMTALQAGTTNDAGVFRAEGISRGPVRVFASAEGHGRNHLGLYLPRSETDPVVVELLEERQLTVRVVDAQTKRPVEGATVHVGDRYASRSNLVLSLLPKLVAEPTDAAGMTTIGTLNARDEYSVNAEAEGYAPPDPRLSPPKTVAPDAVEVTCEVKGFRTVSFPIAEGDARVPQDGTSLELQLVAWMKATFADDAAARIEAGRLVVSGLPPTFATGRVRTPEGLVARFNALMGKDEGSPVTFRQGLEARVRIVERGRGPLTGARVTWTGGVAFGEPRTEVTDARGEATLRGMEPGRITVVLLSGSDAYRGVSAGAIDLNPGNADELHVLEVEPPHPLTLEVTIDGEPGLPPAYELRLGNRWVGPAELVEDAAAGVLQIDTRTSGSAAPQPIELRARGFTSGTGMFRGGGSETVRLALTTAAELTVRVTPPEDGDVSIAIERFDADADRWVNARARRSESEAAGALGGRQEASAQVFLIAESGRFRARDAYSDTYSDPVDVSLGYEAETSIDLSQVVWIRVQVEVPEGTAVHRARVFRTDVEPDHRFGVKFGVPVDGRGRARMRARRGERAALSVRHPVLAAAIEGGRVDVTAGAPKPAVLKLEQGNLLTFRILGRDGKAPPRGRATNVLLAPSGDFGAADVIRAITVVEDGQHTLGGFPAGTYHLWIDAFRDAPIVLGARALGAGTTDLGALTPPAGASLRVKLLADAGATTPNLWVVARRQGAPTFSRAGNRPKGSAEDVRITGLAAGTYEVSIRYLGAAGASPPAPQRVEVGEQGQVDVTFDLGKRGG